MTGPNGFDETETTDEAGKCAFAVTEAGNYLVGIDPDTLPEDSGLRPTATKRPGPDVRSRWTTSRWPAYGAILGVRLGSTTPPAAGDRLINGTVSGVRLGLLLALAAIGLSLIYGTTGLSNFAHAEQVTLGGMLGYLFVNSGAWACGSAGSLVLLALRLHGWLQDFVMWQPLRTTRPGADPDDDRHHRSVAGPAVHLPVLHRREHGQGRGVQPHAPFARPDRQPADLIAMASRSW